MEPPAHSPSVIQALRARLCENGFRPVAVLTRSKKPQGEAWPERARQNPPAAVSEMVTASALSTGILCDGLFAIDIDIDDAAIVRAICEAARTHLGGSPTRTRANSARVLLLYRIDGGELKAKRLSGGCGAIDFLGNGRQFVAYGQHPSGVPYEWKQESGPDSFTRDQLTAVSPEAFAAFIASVAPLVGVEPAVSLKPMRVQMGQGPVLQPAAPATERDVVYAAQALANECAVLATLKRGGRNTALNKSAHTFGGYIANGSIETQRVLQALFEASIANGLVADDGEQQTIATIRSGIKSGMQNPSPTLADKAAPSVDLSAVMALGTTATAQVAKRNLTLLAGSSITEQPITWVWQDYLPSGKLALLAGAGGTGKSTLAFSIAATVTTAGLWPDGTQCQQAGNVLIWSSEDDPSDTIKPRLMAMGADAARYFIIAGTRDNNGAQVPFDPAHDIDLLREAVAGIGGVSLLIIDPIVSAVTGDMHKANDVRRSLQAIVDFAAECSCAVLGITHFAKGTAGKKSDERVIGSQAFSAFARMVLVAAKEEDSERRVFTRAKSNNSVDTGGFSYSIEPITVKQGIIATRIVWGEALQGSSRSILADVEGEETSDASALGRAKQFLNQQLANGPVAAKELFERAREELNTSEKTLRRAKEDAGIIAKKAGFGAGWTWELPYDLAALDRMPTGSRFSRVPWTP